ncbi:MAG: serine/threonine protein kinase [Gemmatimonadaceae bacterium]
MTSSAAPSTLLAGRFEVIRTLGQGAFGRTLLARDARASGGREVAIKLLDQRGRPDAKAYQLFEREADVLRGLRHHGIPEVYETFHESWQGSPAAFLVMEYIEGSSLAQVIEEKRPMSTTDSMHLLLELLGILDYLHNRVPPILHRDIKPANIIVRPNGFPALVDFGSVRRVFLSPEESGSTIAGTYGYMPYEQYMGQASPASDLYAAAATFLHLLTGRAPREFMNDEGRIQVPESLPGESRPREVLARLLRPSPAERFSSARDVRSALTGGSIVPARHSAASLAATIPVRHDVDAIVQSLPPAPRPLEGETKRLMKAAAPSAFRMMNASEKTSYEWSVIDILTIAFLSTITAGLLPIIFGSMARARRRLLKRFFREGVPGSAEVLRIESENTAFGEKLARVNYQFEVDGRLRRDSDMVLPAIAHRWQPGDRIPILYLPSGANDSVIVAVE